MSDLSAAQKLRNALRAWLLGAGINGSTGSEIAIAVNEAFENAVEHPVGRVSENVEVDGEVRGHEVSVSIRDDGAWSDAVSEGPHYGYVLMEGLMDSVEVGQSPSGTTVTLRRAL